MGIIDKGHTRLLLISCALCSVLSLPVQAQEGNGVIVLKRDLQPTAIGRKPLQKDPNADTVNANSSARIIQATGNELGDGDFAGINSGLGVVNRTVSTNGNAGLNALSNPNGLPGMNAGHGGGQGNAISNTINGALSRGLSPLSNLGGGK